jgi:TonB family protein
MGCQAPTREVPTPPPVTTVAPAPPSPATPASAPSAPACVNVGPGVPEPRKITGEQLRFPPGLKGRRFSGGVLVYEANIDERGVVRDVRPLRPIQEAPPWPELDRAARAAVRSWRYTPTVVGGQPTAVCLVVTVIVHVR